MGPPLPVRPFSFSLLRRDGIGIFSYRSYSLWIACMSDKDDAVLHVGNLDRRVTEEQLYSVLHGVAAVVSITIPRRGDSMPAGYALVQLTSGRAARAVVASCSKLELSGRRIVMWLKSSALCRESAASPRAEYCLLCGRTAFRGDTFRSRRKSTA